MVLGSGFWVSGLGVAVHQGSDDLGDPAPERVPCENVRYSCRLKNNHRSGISCTVKVFRRFEVFPLRSQAVKTSAHYLVA